MDMSNDNPTDGQMIQLKTCPRCKTAIRKSLRYGNLIKQQLQNIEEVKKKVNGYPGEIKEAKEKLQTRLTDLKKKFDGKNEMKEWERLERSVNRMTNGIVAAVNENRLTLLERYCFMSQKLRQKLLSEAALRKHSAESRLEGMSLHLLPWSGGLKVFSL